MSVTTSESKTVDTEKRTYKMVLNAPKNQAYTMTVYRETRTSIDGTEMSQSLENPFTKAQSDPEGLLSIVELLGLSIQLGLDTSSQYGLALLLAGLADAWDENTIPADLTPTLTLSPNDVHNHITLALSKSQNTKISFVEYVEAVIQTWKDLDII